MKNYSRQYSKCDQCNCQAENGQGAANVTDGGQRHLVGAGELCVQKQHERKNTY